MVETASTISQFIILMVVSSDVNAACQPASHEYQMHQGIIPVFYPSPIQDNVLIDTVYQIRNARSDVVCAVQCLQNDSCKSFNYCSDNLCQLKTANYSLKGSEIQTSAGCRHYGDEELRTGGDEELQTEGPKTTQVPCPRSYITKVGWTQVEESIDLPMTLEFSVQGSGQVEVRFMPGTEDTKWATFTVGLTSSRITVNRRTGQTTWAPTNTKDIPDLFGKRLYVTYDNGHVEAGVKGMETSHMTYDVISPPIGDRMFLMMYHSEKNEFSFFDPCTHFTLY